MQKKNILTPLDFAILGLLKNEPLSGYGIRKTFETTALGNFSSSPGSIYPALKRLQKFEFVERKEGKKGSKMRFYITPTGLQTLLHWLIKPLEKIDVEKRNQEILLRFAFMEDIVDTQDALKFLESYHILLSNYLTELNQYYTAEKDHLPLFGKLAFEHGLVSYTASLTWSETAILKLQQHETK